MMSASVSQQTTSSSTKDEVTVREFRQIVIWPLQIEGAPGHSASEPTAQLLATLGSGAWRPVEDEFGDASLEERHYREFVSFLPHVQRFLYGDAPGPARLAGYGNSPLRIFRRTDIAAVRVQLTRGSAPITCRVAHIDLHLFYDVNVVILACEIQAAHLPLSVAQELMYRFGRAYPAGWTEDGAPLHCPAHVEWLDNAGNVLSASDYDDRTRYVDFVGRSRSPCFSKHWEHVLKPLVPHASAEASPLRFRQIEYYRMPQMSYLAVDRLAAISRADQIRLAFASGSAKDGAPPIAERFLNDFEKTHCYDRFFHEGANEVPFRTRFLLSGHALTIIAEGDPKILDDNERGLLGQFRHQYYLMFLIGHLHRAVMLMLSDRLVSAVRRLEMRKLSSATAFRREIYGLQEQFMQFTQRYLFNDISDQAQMRDLFHKHRELLGTEHLYTELRHEIFDSVQYLDSDLLRRQSGSMHRLTTVTVLGIIGTTVTGFLGMNLIAAADIPLNNKLWIFGIVTAVVTTLTFVTVLASRWLTALLDRISGEK
jgi:hypothetical protein